MNHESPDEASRSQALDRIIANYYRARDSGHTPDRQLLLAQYS